MSLACNLRTLFFYPLLPQEREEARKSYTTTHTHRDTDPTLATRQNVLLLQHAGTLLPIPDVHCGAVRLWALRPAPAGHPRSVRRPCLADVRPSVFVFIGALARTRRTEGNDERRNRQFAALARPDIETLLPQPIIDVESLGIARMVHHPSIIITATTHRICQ